MAAKVTWFHHDHEQRNYWLRFGFMRLAQQGALHYREKPYAARGEAGFDLAQTDPAEKGVTLLEIQEGGSRRRCIIESNDSFLMMSSHITQADLYFCAGYNTAFFQDRQRPTPLAWQGPQDVAPYHRQADHLIETLGPHFHKVRPFIPISPHMVKLYDRPAWRQRFDKLSHRLALARRPDERPWRHLLPAFEDRYAELLALRHRPVQRDIVLLDTLWGWPRHRIALHQELARLAAQGHSIQARLNWTPPSPWDGSDLDPVAQAGFPMEIGPPVTAYEAQLAQSRLAPYSTGFHYGWRNIMTLALMIGIPILTDRILLEPWFGLDTFVIDWNDSADWSSLGPALAHISDARRAEVAQHNIAAFDQWMTPERTATYVLETALG